VWMLHGTKWRARQSLLSHLIIFLFENPRKTNNISQLWLVGAKRLNKKRWRSSCLVQLDKRGRGKEEEVMDDGEEEAVHVMRIAPSRLHRTSPVGKRRLLWHHRLWQLGKLWPGSCSWNDMLFQPLLSRDLHDNSTYLTGNFCFCFLYSRLVQDRTPIINQNVPLADGLVQHQCTP